MYMRFVLGVIATFVFVFLATSSTAKCNPAQIQEAVMVEGMTITANTSHGLLKIRAGKGCEREYTWIGKSLKTDLIPRTERWYGQLGLISKNLRPPFPNVEIMNIQEHQANYDSYEHFLKYRNKDDPDIYEIYNDEGLMLRFIKRVSPSDQIALDILVAQIRIKGQVPSKILGSRNSDISVSFE